MSSSQFHITNCMHCTVWQVSRSYWPYATQTTFPSNNSYSFSPPPSPLATTIWPSASMTLWASMIAGHFPTAYMKLKNTLAQDSQGVIDTAWFCQPACVGDYSMNMMSHVQNISDIDTIDLNRIDFGSWIADRHGDGLSL